MWVASPANINYINVLWIYLSMPEKEVCVKLESWILVTICNPDADKTFLINILIYDHAREKNTGDFVIYPANGTPLL